MANEHVVAILIAALIVLVVASFLLPLTVRRLGLALIDRLPIYRRNGRYRFQGESEKYASFRKPPVR